MKFINMLIAGLFLTTLVACGGGGGSSESKDPVTEPDPEPDPIDISLANGIWRTDPEADTIILAYVHDGQMMANVMDSEGHLLNGTYTFQTEDILTGTIDSYVRGNNFPPIVEERDLSLVGELGVNDEGTTTLTLTLADENPIVLVHRPVFDRPISQTDLSGSYTSLFTGHPFVVDDDGSFYGQDASCIVSGRIDNISDQTNMANIEYTYQCDIPNLDGTFEGLSAFLTFAADDDDAEYDVVYTFMRKTTGELANDAMFWDVIEHTPMK